MYYFSPLTMLSFGSDDEHPDCKGAYQNRNCKPAITLKNKGLSKSRHPKISSNHISELRESELCRTDNWYSKYICILTGDVCTTFHITYQILEHELSGSMSSDFSDPQGMYLFNSYYGPPWPLHTSISFNCFLFVENTRFGLESQKFIRSEQTKSNWS